MKKSFDLPALLSAIEDSPECLETVGRAERRRSRHLAAPSTLAKGGRPGPPREVRRLPLLERQARSRPFLLLRRLSSTEAFPLAFTDFIQTGWRPPGPSFSRRRRWRPLFSTSKGNPRFVSPRSRSFFSERCHLGSPVPRNASSTRGVTTRGSRVHFRSRLGWAWKEGGRRRIGILWGSFWPGPGYIDFFSVIRGRMDR